MPKPKERVSASTSKSTSHNKLTSKNLPLQRPLTWSNLMPKKRLQHGGLLKSAPSVSPEQPQLTEAMQGASDDDNNDNDSNSESSNESSNGSSSESSDNDDNENSGSSDDDDENNNEDNDGASAPATAENVPMTMTMTKAILWKAA
eukprot:2595090-Pleurochrysis_carterae.AAC.1